MWTGKFTAILTTERGPKMRNSLLPTNKKNALHNGTFYAWKDGKYIRVLIGDYAEKGEAAKARDELRKRKGFADCFVQSR